MHGKFRLHPYNGPLPKHEAGGAEIARVTEFDGAVRPMIKDNQPHNHSGKLVSLVDYELQSSIVKAIIDASPEGILVVDEHGIIVAHNQQFVEIWRIPSIYLRGAMPDNIVGTDDNPILAHNLGCVKDPQAFLARVRELYENPHLDDQCEIELKDGRTLERHSTVLRNDDGQYLGRVWFFRDITPQKQTEVVLKELAHHDPLTGVTNRRYFFERAYHEFARTRRSSIPLSIAVLDIDHFKQINDQNGHAVGDEVLKSLCNNSKNLLRETDIFARIGGEEFAVLLPDTNLEGAACLANRLRKTIADSKFPLRSGGEFSCTVSIGVATLQSTDTRIEDCLSRADSAMYRAKQNGRNRVELDK
jgi:diguanylate cyclase (GGDEF)-like protein